ncbi:MAG: hypothetical protein HOF74_10360 [Gammaproteobacteria bacterium]|jgi:hypothetical protein|nr:hypothetical protein [Gammaproteobacteria bacterium]MBT3860223.1 hypothetical protein [Gammaproteobacteria bacterium]MBT3987515.1 hypothetical protein [Gammaproteobacteria bacterium]MBT4256063.1 hypothetical protein [Gammaproteobacteria bacterium]MBT4581747.1 hypothetical protein [Gammaproteobacteria bacterium]
MDSPNKEEIQETGKKPELQFEYGPVPRGIYLALLWLAIVVPFISLALIPYYVFLLLFLGLGLKPLLLKAGIYAMFQHTTVSLHEKLTHKHTEKRRGEVDRKVRDQKYRGIRRKNPRLPKNW